MSKRTERPNIGGVSIRSRNGALSRRDARSMAKRLGQATNETPPPLPPPLPKHASPPDNSPSVVLGLEVRVREAEKHFLQLVSLEEVRKKLITDVFLGRGKKSTKAVSWMSITCPLVVNWLGMTARQQITKTPVRL